MRPADTLENWTAFKPAADALEGTKQSAFRIDHLSLVAVDQDREAGRFTFRPLVDWPLGPRL